MGVSVIIPTFNSENYIKRCVDSVINEEHLDEIIIVDDGSTDNTLSIAKFHFAKNPKVKILQHEGGVNKGACASRNLGLINAKSIWVQFLDSDDYMEAGYFNSRLELLKSKPDLIIGSFIQIKNGIKHIVNPYEDDIFLSYINFKFGCTNSNLWKRDFLKQIGGWNEEWPSNQDYELYLRALKNEVNFMFSKIPKSYYLKRSNSISTSGINQGWQRQIFLRLELGDYLFEKKMLTKNRSRELHKFLFNKLILLRRNPSRKEEWKYLNRRFINSKWYNVFDLILSSKKSIFYYILGFNFVEFLLNMRRS